MATRQQTSTVSYYLLRSKQQNQPFYFDVRANANGSIIANSETYTSKENAKHAADLMRTQTYKGYRVDQARDGRWYFTFIAKNDRTLVRSVMYGQRQHAVNGANLIAQSRGDVLYDAT